MDKKEFTTYNVLNMVSVLLLGIAWGLILSTIIDLGTDIWVLWGLFSTGILVAIVNSFIFGNKYRRFTK